MNVEEFFEELKEHKHKEINFYLMETQKMIKGFIKKVYIDEDETIENTGCIGIDIKEIKTDEDKLKKYGCKNKGKEGERNNKDRLSLELNNLKDLVSLNKEVQREKVLYRLKFENENIGIIIHI